MLRVTASSMESSGRAISSFTLVVKIFIKRIEYKAGATWSRSRLLPRRIQSSTPATSLTTYRVTPLNHTIIPSAPCNQATMSSRYTVVEPHPSVTLGQQYLSTGRGGAGNAVKAPSTVTRGSDASGPASRASAASLHVPRRSFISGRGGAGNHTHEIPRMFSFDEELQREMQAAKHVAPVYHVGRGGAGNLHKSTSQSADAKYLLSRRDSNNSASSTSSAESGADIATRSLKKGLKKFAGVF